MEFHRLTGQQKGAIGEALFSVGHGSKEVFASWAYHDLHQHERLCPTSPQNISVHHCGRSDCDFHHCDPFSDKPGWLPDFHLYVQPYYNKMAKKKNGPRIEYLLEIKTGSSSVLSSNQRAVMEYIEKTDNRVVPVRTRVDVSRLPDEFGVKFTRIHDRW
jgi:hypothetical protein